jgi:signal transduction histidine kinase
MEDAIKLFDIKFPRFRTIKNKGLRWELIVSKDLVEKSNGNLCVESEKKKGRTF